MIEVELDVAAQLEKLLPIILYTIISKVGDKSVDNSEI
jgi:hypothetical protein